MKSRSHNQKRGSCHSLSTRLRKYGEASRGVGYVSPDLNKDGKVDNADYLLLIVELRKPQLLNLLYDINGDGTVDLLDVKFLYNIIHAS